LKNAASPAALPITWLECRQRGWEYIDVLLVTGDAYIDHPSFGIALIGRLLESHGLQVAILPQPRYDSPEDFRQFPVPRLFCGITAGNLDSIVANYTGNGKVRDVDSYSPDGNPWRDGIQGRTNRRRPDRAVLIYSQLARAAFSETLLVLGGIEASLRRFIHYDYKQEKLRASCLTDAKADLLVYGMGEKAILEIADHCAASTSLHGIAGTCRRCTETEIQDRFADFTGKTSETYLVLPSWEEIGKNRGLFLEAELLLDRHARSCSSRIVLQKQQTHWLVQYPAPPPLGREEFDGLYDLPFSRKPHPSTPNIPAYRMIRDSVTIVRGCSGNCSFCAITRHQGPKVSSRSRKSIVREVEKISKIAGFEGTISDLRRPTLARLFGLSSDRGLSDYLQNGTDLANLIQKTSVDKMTLLASGRSPVNPSELLGSAKMHELVLELAERYDDRFIIFDSPPILAASEAIVLSQKVDGVVLVVRHGVSSRTQVKKIVELIGRDKIIGVVFNGYESSYLEAKMLGQYQYYGSYYNDAENATRP